MSFHGKVLEIFPLDKKQILIGRSPLCDVVVRMARMRDVHFMIQQLNQTDLKRDEGAITWVLFENKNEQSYDNGIVLSSDPREFGGFLFAIVDDRLRGTAFKRGTLARRMREEHKISEHLKDRLILEVIYIKKSLQAVTNVFHLIGKRQVYRCFPNLPTMKVNTGAINNFTIQGIPKDSKTTFFMNGIDVTDSIRQKSEIALIYSDQIHIHAEDLEYILRFVPRIQVPFRKAYFWQDDIFRAQFFSLGALLVLWILLRFVPLPPEVALRSQRRVIRIEKAVEPPPVVPAPQPIVMAQPIVAPIIEHPLEPSAETRPITKLPIQQNSAAKPSSTRRSNSSPAKKPGLSLLSALRKGANSSNSVGDVANMESESGDANVSPTLDLSKRVDAPNLNSISSASSIDNLSSAATEVNTTIATGVKSGALGGGHRGKFNSTEQLNAGLGDGDSDGLELGGGGGQGYALSASGALSREQVKQALRLNNSAFTGCYQSALLKNSTLKGTIVFRWIIDSKGRATSLKMVKSTFEDATLKICLEDAISSIAFPQSKDGRSTKVEYPLHFKGSTQ